MYYPQTDDLVNPLHENLGCKTSRKSGQFRGNRVGMTDLIHGYRYLPLRLARSPNALFVLWGDNHAGVCTTKAPFNTSATYWNVAGGLWQGPGESEPNSLRIVGLLCP